MGSVDGEIRIKTVIDQKDLTSNLQTVQNRITKNNDKLREMRSELDKLNKAKIPTDEFKKLQSEADKAHSELDALVQKQKEMESLGAGVTESQAYAKLTEELDQAGLKAGELDEKMVDLENSGKGFTVDTKSIGDLQQKMSYVESDIEKDCTKFDEMEQKENKVANGFTKIKDKAKDGLSKVDSKAKKSTGLMSTLASRLRGIVLSLLIFNWITKGFNAMVDAFKDGFNNIVQYSNKTNAAMSAFKSQTATLKNNLAAAFSPIANVILPILTKFISWLNKACNAISKFFALLSGSKSYTVATDQVVDYAESLDSAGNSAESAAKKIQKSFAGFDTIQQITTKEEDTSSSSGSGGSSGGTSGGSGFEEVALKESDFKWLDSLKEKFAPVTEAVNNLKAALGPLKTFVATALIDFYKDFLVPVGKWTLGTALPTLIDGLTTMVTDIDWKKLNESLDGLWTSLAPFAINVGNGLLWFYTNVLVPIRTWEVSDVLPAFLDLLKGAIDVLNGVIEAAKPMLKWLWDNFLEPIAEWTGGVIVTVIDDLAIALEWLSKQKAVCTFLAALAIAFAAAKLAAFLFNAVLYANPIVWVIGLIALLVVAIVEIAKHWDIINKKTSEVWNAIKDCVGGALTSIKEWIFDKVGAIKDFWIEKWNAIRDEITTLFGDGEGSIKKKISDTIDKIKSKIDDVLNGENGIVTIWNEAWGNVKTTVVNIWDDIWGAIKGVINSILGGVETMVNGVISGLNAMIKALNNLSFDIPDWVPEIGGKKFGFNITEMSKVSIPRLAEGAVIQPNKQFAAILGDQTSGVNIETPLATMVQAFKQAISESGTNQQATVVMEVSGREFGKACVKFGNKETQRVGISLID